MGLIVYLLWPLILLLFFYFNETPTTEIYTLSLHDALPISGLLYHFQLLGRPGGQFLALVFLASCFRQYPGLESQIMGKPGDGSRMSVASFIGINAFRCADIWYAYRQLAIYFTA